jgi:DNA-binding NtrC family response regulator
MEQNHGPHTLFRHRHNVQPAHYHLVFPFAHDFEPVARRAPANLTQPHERKQRGVVMKEIIRALLVQARHDPLDALRMALEEQSIDIFAARNCAEAALTLLSNFPPHMVFTEIQLADGNWADVLALAGKAPAPVNVIVVAPFVDISFYVQAIERGAFDFIVPPLSDPELLHVVRIAAENALSRRQKHSSVFPGSLLAASQPEHIESEHAVASSED